LSGFLLFGFQSSLVIRHNRPPSCGLPKRTCALGGGDAARSARLPPSRYWSRETRTPYGLLLMAAVPVSRRPRLNAWTICSHLFSNSFSASLGIERIRTLPQSRCQCPP